MRKVAGDVLSCRNLVLASLFTIRCQVRRLLDVDDATEYTWATLPTSKRHCLFDAPPQPTTWLEQLPFTKGSLRGVVYASTLPEGRETISSRFAHARNTTVSQMGDHLPCELPLISLTFCATY